MRESAKSVKTRSTCLAMREDDCRFSPIGAIGIVFRGLLKKINLWIWRKSLRNLGGIRKGKNFPGICSVDLRTNELYDRCLKTRSDASISKRIPIGEHPKIGGDFVLSLMSVRSGKHIRELLGRFLLPLRGGYVVPVLLMVANPKSGAAAIAQL